MSVRGRAKVQGAISFLKTLNSLQFGIEFERGADLANCLAYHDSTEPCCVFNSSSEQHHVGPCCFLSSSSSIPLFLGLPLGEVFLQRLHNLAIP